MTSKTSELTTKLKQIDKDHDHAVETTLARWSLAIERGRDVERLAPRLANAAKLAAGLVEKLSSIMPDVFARQFGDDGEMPVLCRVKDAAVSSHRKKIVRKVAQNVSTKSPFKKPPQGPVRELDVWIQRVAYPALAGQPDVPALTKTSIPHWAKLIAQDNEAALKADVKFGQHGYASKLLDPTRRVAKKEARLVARLRQHGVPTTSAAHAESILGKSDADLRASGGKAAKLEEMDVLKRTRLHARAKRRLNAPPTQKDTEGSLTETIAARLRATVR